MNEFPTRAQVELKRVQPIPRLFHRGRVVKCWQWRLLVSCL